MWDDEYTEMSDDIEEDDYNFDNDDIMDEITEGMDNHARSEDSGWFYDDD